MLNGRSCLLCLFCVAFSHFGIRGGARNSNSRTARSELFLLLGYFIRKVFVDSRNHRNPGELRNEIRDGSWRMPSS